SNGPAAIFALKFYNIDNNSDDLEWAKMIYAWEKATLVDPQTGLVWDNIDLKDGEAVINKDWILTYNQGTFIGAAAGLYSVTNDRTYLNDAIKTSKAIMTSPKVTSEGLLRNENQGDGGLFKGILVRYFASFIQEPDLSETDRNKFTKFFRFNAESFFEKGISRPSMMSSPDWRTQPGDETDLSTQLSGVMLMEAAAQLKEEEIL
ncbi:MAG: glycoside hydrolase family 76 protein, partial [Fulvivirga sp.]